MFILNSEIFDKLDTSILISRYVSSSICIATLQSPPSKSGGCSSVQDQFKTTFRWK